MTSQEYNAYLATLEPGTFWIDNLNWDALATEADVQEVFERVAVLQAERN